MRVAIVGLGIAGLRAAMLLQRAGVDLSLFEARDYLGGRLKSEPEGYDSGGEWIDADHERCLALLHELDLKIWQPPSTPRRFLYQGDWCTEETLWPDALEHEIRLEAAARELCRNLRRPAWDNWEAAALDQMTLGQFIDQHSTTDRGRWYLRARALSDEGDDPERIGLLGWLAGYQNYLQRQGGEMSAFRIQGGARALVFAMADTGVDPCLRKVLQRVEQSPTGVRLTFEDGSSEEFDQAILTLPPRGLEKVIFDPPLTPEKRCAIEACRMSRTIKVCFAFKSRWWREQNWDGAMQCDLALQQTWDGSRDDGAILTSYICGSESERWTSLDDPVAFGVQQLEGLFPGVKEQFVVGWVHDWNSDPFARGGFSQTAPGYVLQHMRHIGTPEGRVHFAGEHTSPWLGFIEGALESAERVANELVR
ncbi:MAG TPA: NAD(P)/FAD-dependent oxidoreductase [Fimbriimonas sp.]|nr:NAD(P)/FAD-dependent oxidoreductase [Fimbriimonas sp.]